MNFMFGSKKFDMYNFYIDQEIFGNKLMRVNHFASDAYLRDCCNLVQKFIDDHNADNVHIIVSTKREGEETVMK